MEKRYISVILAMLFLIFPSTGIKAAEVLEEETTPKYLGAAQRSDYEKAQALKKGIKKYKTKYFVAAMQGYDNNVYLDSRRKGDAFSEGILEAKLTYPMTGRWDVFGGLGVHDISYWEVTDTSLVDTDLKLGFEGKFLGTVKLTALNDIEIVDYPYNGDGSYVGDKAGFKVRHTLSKASSACVPFHGFGYEYFYKNYSDRKARDSGGQKTGTDRADARNTLSGEIGAFFKKAMVKLSGEFYKNDANDRYLNYYDYRSKRVELSFIYLVTDKFTASLSLGHQRKDYIDRETRVDSTKTEIDKIFTVGTMLMYQFHKNGSLGFNYSYRENDSNDPAEEYSGSLGSLGVYCNF